MSLLAEFLAITEDWRSVFPQQRSFQRAVRQALGSLVLSRPALPDSYHLDQWRPVSQWERRVFSPLALPVGAAAMVSSPSCGAP
jgi:hypothetical protein